MHLNTLPGECDIPPRSSQRQQGVPCHTIVHGLDGHKHGWGGWMDGWMQNAAFFLSSLHTRSLLLLLLSIRNLLTLLTIFDASTDDYSLL